MSERRTHDGGEHGTSFYIEGEPPKGKSMKELRAIVEADRQRFDELGELWNMLSDDEQQRLIDEAQRMVEAK